MIKKCNTCSKFFKTFPCRVGKFCSYACNNDKKKVDRLHYNRLKMQGENGKYYNITIDKDGKLQVKEA